MLKRFPFSRWLYGAMNRSVSARTCNAKTSEESKMIMLGFPSISKHFQATQRWSWMFPKDFRAQPWLYRFSTRWHCSLIRPCLRCLWIKFDRPVSKTGIIWFWPTCHESCCSEVALMVIKLCDCKLLIAFGGLEVLHDHDLYPQKQFCGMFDVRPLAVSYSRTGYNWMPYGSPRQPVGYDLGWHFNVLSPSIVVNKHIIQSPSRGWNFLKP